MTTYQPNIPTGLVKLNVDYKNIRDNFQQLDTSFGKDHVTFSSGTAQNGFHEDIHFNPFSTVATVPTPNNYDFPTQYPVQGTVPPGAPPTLAGIGQLWSAQVNDSINADTGLYWLSGLGNKVALTRNFVPSHTASGSTFLPGGLILKWGTQVIAIGGTAVTWPAPAFTTFFSATVSAINGSVGGLRIPNFLNAPNAVGATIYVKTDNNSPATATVFYMAIGM